MKVEYHDGTGFCFWVGLALGVVVTAIICTYMWCEPAMECDKYKQIVAEQQAIIERYQIQNETMMQIIDGVLEEEKK